MNTNPSAKRILIYGDSLTWGRVANKFERFPSDVRFTGVIQKELGDNYEVIEEGLRSRMVTGENPFSSGKDGYQQFAPILSSHLPVDLLVIFLGTNDSSFEAGKTPEQIVKELEIYKELMVESSEFMGIPIPDKIMFVAPPIATEKLEMFKDAPQKMQSLAELIKEMCTRNDYLFFDSNGVVKVSEEDGVHLNKEGNILLGKALANFIRNCL